jgi:hypothetical protein
MRYSSLSIYSLSGTEHVERPRGRYNGQKLIMLVAINTTDKPINAKPSIPDVIFSAYKPTKTRATTTRMARSKVPIFGFIIAHKKNGETIYPLCTKGELLMICVECVQLTIS